MNTQMDTMEKLRILSDAAKYDAACTSSGVNRAGVKVRNLPQLCK